MPKPRRIPYINNGKVFVGGGLRKKKRKSYRRGRKSIKKIRGRGLGSAISNLASGLVNPLIKLLS